MAEEINKEPSPEAGGKTELVEHDGILITREYAEKLKAEKETRIGEVLELASSASSVISYGFPEAAYGSDRPEMIGLLFTQRDGEQRKWQHVPIARIIETLKDCYDKVSYFHKESKPGEEAIIREEMMARITTSGGKTWEVPSSYWQAIVGSAYAANPAMPRIGRSPYESNPARAKIQTLADLGPNQYLEVK